MRSIGNTYAGCRKFFTVMNISTIPTRKNVRKLNKALKSVVFVVAQGSKDFFLQCYMVMEIAKAFP